MARKRSTDSTPYKKRDWTARFLEGVRRTGNATQAAEGAGVHRTLPYKTRLKDRRFADAWDEAEEMYTDSLEDQLHKLIFEGGRTVKRRIKRDATGAIVDDVEEVTEGQETVALIFALKARRPEKYNPTLIEAVRKAVADAFASLTATGQHGPGRPPDGRDGPE